MSAISNATKREVRLGELFVKLADTLVNGFDLSDLLHTLVDETTAMLPVDEAALFLADPAGELRVAAATNSTARSVEILVLEADEGPCLDAYRTGSTVGVHDVSELEGRWPSFAKISLAGGFRASHAIPMKLRGTTIGVLNLFSDYPYTPSEVDASVAKALADAASIAIIQYRNAHDQQRLSDQLQHALDSRVLIEQAKGVLSQTHGLSMNEAFVRLRAHARQSGATLRDISERVIDRSLTL